jgi:hypothetical protein
VKVISYDVTVNDYPHMPHLRQQIREHWVQMPGVEDCYAFNLAKGQLNVFPCMVPRNGLGQMESTINDAVAESLGNCCKDRLMLQKILETWVKTLPKPVNEIEVTNPNKENEK